MLFNIQCHPPEMLASSSITFPLEMAQVDTNKRGKWGNDEGNKSSLKKNQYKIVILDALIQNITSEKI